MLKRKTRIPVRKTPKLYIGGAFVRSESGRTLEWSHNSTVLNVARASRKDVREAVRAARSAFAGWSSRAAYNRGQILYRLAEMMETRRSEFNVSQREFEASVDRVVWYAGWCDKIEQFLSTKNAVAGPHFNVSAPEPTGVVGIVTPQNGGLLGIVSTVLPAVAGANSAVALLPYGCVDSGVAFAEAIATSDMPGGVINVLTGDVTELTSHLARHMDVNALSVWSTDPDLRRDAQLLGAENVKRIDVHSEPEARWWFSAEAADPRMIAASMEIKTVWHPAGY
jgi:acyl-CoA reductase-like NAD-dependent aldehyde dehydrogenase